MRPVFGSLAGILVILPSSLRATGQALRETATQRRRYPDPPATESSPGKSARHFALRHQPFLLVLGLYAAILVASLLTLRPGGYLLSISDYEYYYAFAQFSNRGLYPFVDFWLEYPPVFPWMVIGLYKLSLLLPAWGDSSFLWFRWLLGGVLLAFQLGSLVLVYAIALRLYPSNLAWRVAAFYAALFWPFYIWMAWFEPMPLFFLLLGLFLAIRGQVGWAGLVAGLGFMVKILPALALLPALKVAPTRRARILCLVAAVAGASLAAAPLLPHVELLQASFISMLARSPWESIWAVLDGYYDFGRVAPLHERTTIESARWMAYPPGLGSRLAAPALLLAGGLYMALWWRSPARPASKHLVALCGLAVIGFLLVGKGYSPQFLAYALPFVLLVSPDRYGLGYALGLSAVNLVEWPIYHLLLDDQPGVLVGVIAARSVLLLAVVGDHLGLLLGWHGWKALRRMLYPVLMTGLIGLGLVGAALTLPSWFDQQARQDPYAGPIRFVLEHTSGGTGFAFTDDILYHHFYPLTWREGELSVLRPHGASQADRMRSPKLSEEGNRERLLGLLERHGSVWLIVYENDRVADGLRASLREVAELRHQATYDPPQRDAANDTRTTDARLPRPVQVQLWETIGRLPARQT